jgi:hypothetical protein
VNSARRVLCGGRSVMSVPTAIAMRLSRGTQIPEYVLQGCLAAFKSRNRPSLFVLKSRTETDARKEDSVIFVLISPTNFSRNFVRDFSATFRGFSAMNL